MVGSLKNNTGLSMDLQTFKDNNLKLKFKQPCSVRENFFY